MLNTGGIRLTIADRAGGNKWTLLLIYLWNSLKTFLKPKIIFYEKVISTRNTQFYINGCCIGIM
jgi:hypothetical protein